MEKFETGQTETNSFIPERNVAAALTKSLPSATDRNYKPNGEVLIFDELSLQWNEAYIVLNC